MKLLTAEFPQARLRRNRQDPWCRDLVAEHRLSSSDLILPLFVRERRCHETFRPCLVFFATFWMSLLRFVKKHKMGKAMRALADDRQAASLVGIPVNQVISVAFLIGSALAGAGGVMFGMYYNTINFHDGYLAGLKAFTAAVLGGIGNIPGAMIGGVLLGVLEGLGAGYLSSEWKNVFAFFILILILLFRPSGLLGTRVVKKV